MNTALQDQRGFTLIEFNVAMVSGVILMLGFATLLYFSRKHTESLSHKVLMNQDIAVFEELINDQLMMMKKDSLDIYASESDEQNGITGTTGSIFTSYSANNTPFRLGVTDNVMEWSYDGSTNRLLDGTVPSLAVTLHPSFLMDISYQLVHGTDTLNYDRSIYIRN